MALDLGTLTVPVGCRDCGDRLMTLRASLITDDVTDIGSVAIDGDELRRALLVHQRQHLAER